MGAFSRVGVTGVLDGADTPSSTGGMVLEPEAWCGAFSEADLEVSGDDSVLFRGKGNSSAGGIGRMLGAPLSSEIEEESFIVGGEEVRA